MNNVADIETVVIGAGVIGLAIARAAAMAGQEVLILESTDCFGSATSSRNSEVIHAGIYYSTDSLKARFCVAGKALLYDYCASHGVETVRRGKLIIASTADQQRKLSGIQQRARANGVDDLRLLSAREVSMLEPAIKCVGALHSPSTGVIDSHGYMLSLLGDAESHGAMISYNAPVHSVQAASGQAGPGPTASGRSKSNQLTISVADDDRTTLSARHIINAAGHGAVKIAQSCSALDPSFVPEPVLAKGNYFRLTISAPIQRLIYPMPEQGGLGIHVTIGQAGQARFGPDVEWIDKMDYAVDAARAASFYSAIRQYWPALPDNSLVPDYAGIRPKIRYNGNLYADFLVQGPRQHHIPGLINLFGIESPGLTASLALADHVVELLKLDETASANASPYY